MKSFIKIVLCMSALSLSNCKTTSHGSSEIAEAEGKQSADTCSNEAMAERREKVFNRTSSCLVEAVSFSMAAAVQKLGTAAGEMHAFANAIRLFNKTYGQAANLSINVAKGALCARIIVGEYIPYKTTAYIANNLINKSQDKELEPIDTLAKNILAAGGPEVLHAIHEAVEHPSAESILKIITSGGLTFGEIRLLFGTCGPIFASVLSNNAPNIVAMTALSEHLAKIGVYAAIASCASAGLFNAIDVGTEYQCLQKDLEYLEKQNKAILASEKAACDQLKPLASLPSTLPIMKNVLNEKNTDGTPNEATNNRTRICHKTISSWGRCLASHPIDRRSQTWCEMLCKGNSQQVQPNIRQVLKASNLENIGVEKLITTYNQSCISAGNPEPLVRDQIQPCVSLCMSGTGE